MAAAAASSDTVAPGACSPQEQASAQAISGSKICLCLSFYSPKSESERRISVQVTYLGGDYRMDIERIRNWVIKGIKTINCELMNCGWLGLNTTGDILRKWMEHTWELFLRSRRNRKLNSLFTYSHPSLAECCTWGIGPQHCWLLHSLEHKRARPSLVLQLDKAIRQSHRNASECVGTTGSWPPG